jgi:hypothetical protein
VPLRLPGAGRGGVAGKVGEVAWRAPESALDAVGEVGVAAVEDLAEQVAQEFSGVRGDALGGERRDEGLDGDRLVAQVSAAGACDLLDGLVERDEHEDEALWTEFARLNPGFAEYRNLTERELPVLVLDTID